MQNVTVFMQSMVISVGKQLINICEVSQMKQFNRHFYKSITFYSGILLLLPSISFFKFNLTAWSWWFDLLFIIVGLLTINSTLFTKHH